MKKQNIFLFRKTIVDRDSGNLYKKMYSQYIYKKKIVVFKLLNLLAGDLGRPSCLVYIVIPQ